MGSDNHDLTWFDEFDGNKLDRTKWDYSLSSFDPKARTQMAYRRPANVSLKRWNSSFNGTARRRMKWNPVIKKNEWVDRENTYKDPKTGQWFISTLIYFWCNSNAWTVTGVLTEFVGDFYAESRIKLPFSESSWASFWWLEQKGGGSPKRRLIFESKGYDPNYIQANVHTEPSKSGQYSESNIRIKFPIMEIRKQTFTYGS